MTYRLKLTIFRCFALVVALIAVLPAAEAQTFPTHYTFSKATVSLPVISQGMNATGTDFAYQYDRLLTKQAINLIRGRALTDKVPKNEVLAIAAPHVFPSPAPVLLVVIDITKIDKTAKPFQGQDGLIIATGAAMTSAQFVLGKNGGKNAIGFGTVETKEVGNGTNGLLENTLQASARVSGTRIVASGVSGPFKFNKAGAMVDGLLAGGTLRSSGALLCEMTMEVDITPPGI